MSSMRVYSRMMSSGSELAGTHCVVQWDEPGSPRNVVQRKKVFGTGSDPQQLAISSECRVQIREGAKNVEYPAKLLGCGSKRDMDTMLDALEGSPETPPPKKRKTVPAKKSLFSDKMEAMLEALDDSPELLQTPKKRKTVPAKKNLLSKKKSQQENDCVTAQLLAGLSDSSPSSEQLPPPPSSEQQVQLPSLSFSPESCSPSPHHHTRVHIPVTPSGAVLSSFQLSNSRRHTSTPVQDDGWLGFQFRELNRKIDAYEFQFRELHRKIDAQGETINHLKGMLTKKKGKKVQFEVTDVGGVERPEVLEEANSESSATDPLMVCCGQPGIKGKHAIVKLPSEAALAEFQMLNSCPPSTAAMFSLRMLSVFFSDSELADSNCTKAEGRQLLNQIILAGIKHHTNLKYPLPPAEVDARWTNIVVRSLNNKCRCVRRKLKVLQSENFPPDEEF